MDILQSFQSFCVQIARCTLKFGTMESMHDYAIGIHVRLQPSHTIIM